jgi:hypothetical protein
VGNHGIEISFSNHFGTFSLISDIANQFLVLFGLVNAFFLFVSGAFASFHPNKV